jgi:TusA-related sulfurtransferase
MGGSKGRREEVIARAARVASRRGPRMLEIIPMGSLRHRLDLRGVKCPLNWAHAKVKLETMERGEILELVLDDPRGARDIPPAAEAEGYSILDSRATRGKFHISIEK